MNNYAKTGREWMAGYLALTRRNCSAFEWFILKAGSRILARKIWDACDGDRLLREANGRS